jgi:hypothetical protein
MKTNLTTQLIMTTYPGFHDLPKGIKRMLLVSESFFFDELRTRTSPAANPLVPLPPALTGTYIPHRPPAAARTVAATG